MATLRKRGKSYTAYIRATNPKTKERYTVETFLLGKITKVTVTCSVSEDITYER